jgi:hypothetical protein
MESARLDPWARRARRLLVDYPTVLQALDRLVRQMRRVAYTINEADRSWSALSATQTWPLDYAGVLEEVGDIVQVAAGALRSPATPSGIVLDAGPAPDILRLRIAHAQQQLAAWETHLAHHAPEAQQAQHGTAPPEPANRSPIGGADHIALRGALLTDLRRMLDEAQDMVEATAHAPRVE